MELAIMGLAVILAAFGSGCAKQFYRAGDLPAEYVAPATTNLDALDLSRFVGKGTRSEWIHWGDVLEVTVRSGLETDSTDPTMLRVARDGTIGVPLVGRVGVAGMGVERAEAAIAAASRYRQVFPNPHVSVRIDQRRMNCVTVIGAVEEPGTYELPRGASSLMAGLVAAGGLSEEAGTGVEIRRQGPQCGVPGLLQAGEPRPAGPNGAGPNGAEQVAHHQYPSSAPTAGRTIHVNLIAPEVRGEVRSAGKHELEDGDVVHVAKRDLQPVYVMGLVKKPGEFKLPSNKELRVLDSLALAGGCSSQVADKVVVVRRLPDQSAPISIVLSIQRAINGPDNLALAPGDTVIVKQTPETIVVDTLKSLVRFGISGSVPLF
jgi:polysaccharide export outer membrane protein